MQTQNPEISLICSLIYYFWRFLQIHKIFHVPLEEKMVVRGHFGRLFSIKEPASVELMDGDKLESVFS